MKFLVFDNEKDFLNELDGKVYAVCNNRGKIICDILEKDYLTLVNNGSLIDAPEKANRNKYYNFESDYIIPSVLDKHSEYCFKEKYGVSIKINE